MIITINIDKEKLFNTTRLAILSSITLLSNDNESIILSEENRELYDAMLAEATADMSRIINHLLLSFENSSDFITLKVKCTAIHQHTNLGNRMEKFLVSHITDHWFDMKGISNINRKQSAYEELKSEALMTDKKIRRVYTLVK